MMVPFRPGSVTLSRTFRESKKFGFHFSWKYSERNGNTIPKYQRAESVSESAQFHKL